MDIEFFAIGFTTVGFIALAFGIFAAIRNKSVVLGLIVLVWLFFFFAMFFGVIGGFIGLLYIYNYNASDQIQMQVGNTISIVGALIVAIVLIIHLLRQKSAGNLAVNGQTKNAYLSQGIMMLLWLYCQITVLIDVNRDEVVKRNAFWWFVIICLALYFFYPVERRERGLIYRGKIILFSDIANAQWDSQWYKTKLKITLKNDGKELALKIPPEITATIDDYLRANFPRP